MRTTRAATMFLAIGVLCACAPSSPPDPDPAAVVKGFYGTYLSLHPTGVPEEVQLSKLRPYLSDSLVALFRDADAAETAYRKRTNNEQPPLVEGDLFTSLFEGASAFEVLPAKVKGDRASCLVRFSYQDPNPKYSTRWRDRVFLVKGASGWAIDDIEYMGDWQFMHKGRLRDLLAQVIKDGAANP